MGRISASLAAKVVLIASEHAAAKLNAEKQVKKAAYREREL